MALISLHSVHFSYAGPEFLNDITFHLESGERICIIGRNGAGKSTFLKLLSGDAAPLRGTVERVAGLRVGYLPQIVPDHLDGSVFEAVADGLGTAGRIVSELESLRNSRCPSADRQMETLRSRLGDLNEWDLVHRVERTIKTCRLEPDDRVASMSAGMKRRVILARAFVSDPRVLLLDEPTNHLDIPTIEWLEDTLLQSKMTLAFITHDRMLVEKLATRIVEIDRGSLHNWACDYRTYLQRRDQLLTTQDRQKSRLDRKVDQETQWLHRGVKARGTRNEGRVKALKQLREERKAWRELTGSVRLRIQEAQRSGRLVIDAENVSFAYDTAPVIHHFSTSILRGDRIGIMGPNGCGKSTLLRLILGDLKPQTGVVRTGTKLSVAYFDQLRQQLDPEKSVIDCIAGGLREVTIGGRPRHVFSYLKDFLFDPAEAEAPVKTLSGGERNRLLLARLFTKESNLLVLDEPTNDLDADTMDILETQLMNYSGTVLVVSHDRTFLNNVVTATLVFEPDGRIQEYAGGYDDWLLQRQSGDRQLRTESSWSGSTTEPVTKSGAKRVGASSEKPSAKKLSYHLVRELAVLPGEIEILEQDMQDLYAQMSSPEFYLSPPDMIRATRQKLQETEALLDRKMARWAELDDQDQCLKT
jgi:ABC transport system ATP-binding/permease protein